MKKYSRDLFFVAFVISLFLHLLSGLIVFLKKPSVREPIVEVEFLDKKEMEKRLTRQIVEQSEKRLNDEIDPKAKYLSRYNQKVIQETKAANHGKFQNEYHQGQAPKSEQNIANQKKPKTLPDLNALKPQFQWDKKVAGVSNPGPVSQTDDHLKNLPTAGETLLSSREFVYYSYYSRIKERLRIYWEPKIRDKINRILMSGRRIASDEDRITKLVITLDRDGKLIRVQVLSASGMKDLDDAGIEAFQAAAPFPNPPAGIVDADGTIKINWEFILEVQAGLFKPEHPENSEKFVAVQ